MRSVFVSLLLLFVCTVSVQGQVKVIGSVVPNAPSDKYPTHTDIYGKGGFRAVADIADRNSISPARRSAGMLVYCIQEAKFFQLVGGTDDSNWEELVLSAGPSGGPVADATNVSKGVIRLAGDLSGTAVNPVVSSLGGLSVLSVTGALARVQDASATNETGQLVTRDADGNFAAGVITADLVGNATNVTGTVAVLNGGTGGNTPSEARTNLGLGSISVQDEFNVSVSGGKINGVAIGIDVPAAGAFSSLSSTGGLSVVGDILATGNITANSDMRIKKNVKELPAVTESLRQITAVEYDRKDVDMHQIGLLAQDVQRFFPALISVGKDSAQTLSLNYQSMVAPLLKGWQESDQRVVYLERTVNYLEKEIEELKKLLKKQKKGRPQRR